MRFARYQYKEKAKALLQGKYEKPIVIMLVIYLVNIIFTAAETSALPKYSLIYPFEMTDPGNPSMTFLLSIISLLITAAFSYSVVKMAIYLIYQRKTSPEEILIAGFKENYVRNLTLHFLRSIYTVLWCCLFVIPGLIKAYAYSMSFYLVNKEPSLLGNDAITKSKKMTKGYKTDIFLLDLSYLGWYFLGCFTLGILWLWIIPRHMSARMLYFEEIYNSVNVSINKYEEL